MRGKGDQTIAHIVVECPSLAQNEYKKWRHDQVARMIHWKLCEKWGFERGEMWYTYNVEKVLESDLCKILWDFSIQTDKKMNHNRPDITVTDKVNKTCLIIDPSCPFDPRILVKEEEKSSNYDEHEYELAQIWSMKKVTIVPIVIGALGTVTERIDSWIEQIGIDCLVALLRKGFLLGSAKIVRKVTNG